MSKQRPMGNTLMKGQGCCVSTIQLRFADLSMANWRLLLQAMVAPSLQRIFIEGDTSVSALSQFLRRHGKVSTIEFTRISNPWHHLYLSSLTPPSSSSSEHTFWDFGPTNSPIAFTIVTGPIRRGLTSMVLQSCYIVCGLVKCCAAQCYARILANSASVSTCLSKLASYSHIGFSSRRHHKQEYLPQFSASQLRSIICLTKQSWCNFMTFQTLLMLRLSVLRLVVAIG